MNDEILEKWSEEYQVALSTPPAVGSIIKPINGDAVLTVEIQDNKPPFIYGRAFVPEIPGQEPKWYLQNEEYRANQGYKCILMARARTELIKKCGLKTEIKVKSLRVIKPSQSGKSLLCEVENYCG